MSTAEGGMTRVWTLDERKQHTVLIAQLNAEIARLECFEDERRTAIDYHKSHLESSEAYRRKLKRIRDSYQDEVATVDELYGKLKEGE